MKRLYLFFIVVLLYNSCNKSETQKIADEYYKGNVDSLYVDLERIKAQEKTDRKIKIKDSIKFYHMVEFFVTESPKCNTFRDIYYFNVELKDTIGLNLKELSEYLLKINRPYDIDLKNCDYPFYHDVIIYKNLHDAKNNKENWLIMNSPGSGFNYADYNK